MERKSHYATVSEAISELRKQGYTRDFNLEENSTRYHFSDRQFELYQYNVVEPPS
jgi:hypothetical protein